MCRLSGVAACSADLCSEALICCLLRITSAGCLGCCLYAANQEFQSVALLDWVCMSIRCVACPRLLPVVLVCAVLLNLVIKDHFVCQMCCVRCLTLLPVLQFCAVKLLPLMHICAVMLKVACCCADLCSDGSSGTACPSGDSARCPTLPAGKTCYVGGNDTATCWLRSSLLQAMQCQPCVQHSHPGVF